MQKIIEGQFCVLLTCKGHMSFLKTDLYEFLANRLIDAQNDKSSKKTIWKKQKKKSKFGSKQDGAYKH